MEALADRGSPEKTHSGWPDIAVLADSVKDTEQTRRYSMDLRLDEAVAVLQRTPSALRALLADLPQCWLRSKEGPDTFSPYEVLGHLLHGEETDWMPRARMILEHGESTPFAPFDRFAFREKYRGKEMSELLDMFEAIRSKNLEALDQMALGGGQLRLPGRHPELGRVTLGQLLATWVVHDLAHISQIVRVMARQYDSAVGPGKANLAIINKSVTLMAA
jgi:hypothetical protein